MNALSARLRPFALTALRLVVGVIMITHGWMKLMSYDGWVENLASMGMPLPEVMAPLAIAGELGGGIGLLLGLLTPIAAAGVLSTMLVAIFLVHLPNGLLAKDGGFEYPLALAAVAIFFIVRGAGPFSLDRLLFGRAADDAEEEEGVPRAKPREAHA